MEQKTDSQTGDGVFCEMEAVSELHRGYSQDSSESPTLGESERRSSCGRDCLQHTSFAVKIDACHAHGYR